MTYTEFKSKWLGDRVQYPPLQTYECVSLVKQYLQDCFGIRPGSWGNAKNYWLNTNPALLATFSRLQGVEARTGDILVFRPTTTNSHGHIAIAHDHAIMLEQNAIGSGTGRGADAVRFRAIPYGRLYGVLRPKQKITEDIMNRGDIINVFRSVYGREPNENDFTYWMNRPFKDLMYQLMSEPNFGPYKTKEVAEQLINAKATAAALTDELKQANATIAELQNQAKVTVSSTPEPAIITATVTTPTTTKKPSLLTRFILAFMKKGK